MNYRDYYQILGVPQNAGAKEVECAYRNLARQFHPQKSPTNQPTENKSTKINEAAVFVTRINAYSQFADLAQTSIN